MSKKRKSYAELIDEVTRLQGSESLLHVALHLVNNARPDATERAHVEGGRYILSLYGATRACGGIVVSTYHHKGQTPQTDAAYLDDMERIQSLDLQIASAVNRLTLARNRLLLTPAHQ